ncbi:uncharacterized protein B0T15DRAFT_280173 [Chaetomium strumarium]|uniref:Smr domain-containing protein n=1 Tax=Chaetomium strumarium TaxID=1170767 RepID=A0AAJ0GP88_9PEZI|nr:hypothetical protein B0T15DRAFT_280173 [Chaetomium strumarium]
MSAPRPPDTDGDVAERYREKLLEEFGSVLDESLIVLIANERDLVKDYDEIRHILCQLAESAREEAATGFDPSGLGSFADLEEFRLDETTSSGNGGADSSAGYATTISVVSDQSENHRLTEQVNLSDEQKVQELKLVFQDRWKDHTIRYVLKQCNGNLETAFDELLSRQYLEESGELPKGIDGFCIPDEDRQPGKSNAGRGQKGRKRNKKQVVAITYDAVLPTVDDAELEGAKDFHQTAGHRGAGLVRRLPPPSRPPLSTVKITPQSGPPYPPASPSPLSTDFGASNLRTAAALRRMGPLGRQGAVVYTERAREEIRTFQAQASLMAETLVAQQSTDSVLDLHGVFVMDGVRIAKQRVWAWWNGLGENRKARAKQHGFTVVTGVGKHSAGGVSRLRQAVGAYLKNDGWKAETLTGSFYVTGRV